MPSAMAVSKSRLVAAITRTLVGMHLLLIPYLLSSTASDREAAPLRQAGRQRYRTPLILDPWRPLVHPHRNSAARTAAPGLADGWAFGAQRCCAPRGLVGRFYTKAATQKTNASFGRGSRWGFTAWGTS